MGIAPIDLQTLFTQVDKVGKAQAAQKEGQALHQAILGVQLQKKIEENIQQVNEAQNTGDGAEKVGDQKHGHEGGKQEKHKRDAQEEENQASVLRDQYLGNTIDISR
jgi:ribonucleotide reductase alpha subunit